MTATYDTRDQPHPVSLEVAYPERLSRVLIFFKIFLIIPHLIAIYLLSIALYVLTLLAWFSILFTGRYPTAFFEFTSGVLRWQVNAFTYVALLRDEYPPFSWEPGAYPLALDIPRPGRQSRFRLFIRWPAVTTNLLVLGFIEVAWAFTSFIAWFAILITGRYPRGLFNFAVGGMRWYIRALSYAFLLRDEFPPYSLSANARPGREALSAILGLPIFAVYIAVNLLAFSGAYGGRGTTVHASILPPSSIARTHPTGRSGSLRITLLDYRRDVLPPDSSSSGVPTGYEMDSFAVRAEKDGWLPTFFTPYFFSAKTCEGFIHGVESDADAAWDSRFNLYWRSGVDDATLYFRVPKLTPICELDYFGGRGQLRFKFD